MNVGHLVWQNHYSHVVICTWYTEGTNSLPGSRILFPAIDEIIADSKLLATA